MPVGSGRNLNTLLRSAAFLAAGLAVPVWGQSAVDGAIAGRVVSAEGDAIAGAEILLEGEQGERRTVVSGSKGEFMLVRLTPGAYRLMARAPGYRGQVELGAVVELGRTTELEVGHAVVARRSESEGRRHAATGGLFLAPLPSESGRRRLRVVDAKESALRRDPNATVVTPGELESLPVAGPDWMALARETPGMQADPDADGQTLLTVRGMDTTQNASRVDGMSHDQSFGAVPMGAGASVGREAEDDTEEGGPGTGGGLSGGSSGAGLGYGRHAGAASTFSQAAVREFRLSEQGYSALYGHGAGGVSTVVSRSGTNEVHGSGFVTLRNSAWGATNPFSVATTYSNGLVASGLVKPPDSRQQEGGSLGGPLWRGRLFYFGAYDKQHRDFPAVSSPSYPEFYSLTATQTALLGTRGVTAAKTMAALNYLSSLTGTVPRTHDQTIAFGKIDMRAKGENHVSVQYNHAVWASPAGGTTAAVVARGTASLGNNDGTVDEAVARWTTFLGKGLSNEVRAGYARDFQYETAQAPLPQEPAVGPGGFAPEINIAPQGLLFGTPAALGRKAYPDERRMQVAEVVGWVKGRHLVRAGGELSMVHDLIDALANQEGTFNYDSGTTGGHAGGLVDWITDYTFNVHAYPNGGCPSIHAAVHDFCFRSFSQSFGQQTTTFDTQEWAGFVQEDWRVRAGLTLNVGVRYEYELLPFPKTPNATLDAIFGKGLPGQATAGTNVTGNAGATSVFPEDTNNYGPRIGMSWAPFGRRSWVVHAGFGLYFGRLPGTTIRSAMVDTALAASTTHVRILPTTETQCPQVTGASQGFGYACAYLTTPPAAVAATTSATVFDKRFQLPSVQQGSFTVEHEMGTGLAASLSYRMNSDRQLPNSVDINIAPATAQQTFQLQGGTGAIGVKDGETFVVPVYTSRVSTSFGPVTDIVSNSNGTYQGLVAELQRRGRGGLDFHVSWTWSKAIDYGQTGGGTPRTNGQFDPFKLGYDKGLSNLNYPHRVVASVMWSPTVRAENRWVRAAANGWEAAPVFIGGSGRPYSLQIFGGTRLSGGHESINGSGGATYLPTVGRNTQRMPDRMSLDLRVSRSVRLSERVKVRAAAEVFNAMNHVNYSGVQTRAFLVGMAVNGITPLVFQDAATVAAEGLNVRPFGQYTAAGTSDVRERQVQLGFRLEF